MALPIVPYTGPIVTRAAAKAKGLKRYFMGPDKPCKYGHISERTTVDGGCILCARTAAMSADQIAAKRRYALKYDEAHRDEKNEATRARYREQKAADPAALRAKWRDYKAANKEKSAAWSRRWYQNNWEARKAKRDAERDIRAARSKAWAQANPERAAAKTKRWQQRNPGKVLAYRETNKEKIAASSKAWKQANPDKVRASVRKWHKAHPEWLKNWRKANPEAYRAQVQTRKALMASAEGRHTAKELRALLEQQNWRCGYCRVSIRKKYSVDHIQPLSRGGSNWITNIQLLCQSCNSAKQDSDPIEYARRIGLLI